MVDKYKMKCYINTNKRKEFRQKGTKEFLNSTGYQIYKSMMAVKKTAQCSG